MSYLSQKRGCQEQSRVKQLPQKVDKGLMGENIVTIELQSSNFME